MRKLGHKHFPLPHVDEERRILAVGRDQKITGKFLYKIEFLWLTAEGSRVPVSRATTKWLRSQLAQALTSNRRD
jgi:hypothetical protein